MYMGADYYPEHWPESRWPTDAKLMKKAGFNVVRLAEFAWVNMEPEEGIFTFHWLDRALAILARYDVSAILCTPTAVMPAWVARKYPETLAMKDNHTRITWGVRKNNCFTAGAYRLLSQKITRAMAEHFKNTPNVIGWQTDNEFGHPVCYCNTCRAEFQDWLRARYKTLNILNKGLGTHFWGHKYQTWGEIQIPVEEHSHNPSLCLEWRRFYSWLNVQFQKEQVDILKKTCPRHFVTHNFMGYFSELNYYDLAADLDHVSWDNYPVWGKTDIHYSSAGSADVMRGLKQKNFWIMEQTAGPGGWGAFGRNPRPGEIRKIAYQQLAHGADNQIWFRWRTCTAGREQYWHGLLGHDGRALRRYKEAADTAREYHKLAKHLENTTIKTPVAIVYDYESIWALKIQPGYDGNNYHEVMERYYRALFRAGVNVDMVKPTQDLSKYRLVLTPDLHILPDNIAKTLNNFVKKGGVLLADCRTGVKNETNLCHERTLPGLLSDSLGITIEEYEAIPKDDQYTVNTRTGFEGSFSAIRYADWTRPSKAHTLAGYQQWHLKNFAALTRNRYGKGTAYYLGTFVKEDAFYDQLIAELLKTARIRPILKPPAGIEVSVRRGKGKKLLLLINHTEEQKTVPVPKDKKELITGKTTKTTITLDKYGVAVISLTP